MVKSYKVIFILLVVSYIFDILTREHPLDRPTGPIPYNRRKKVGVGSVVDCGNGVDPGYRRTINGRQLSRGHSRVGMSYL